MKNLYKILASSIAIFAFCACSQEEMPVNQSDNNQSEVVTRSATGIKNIVYIEVNDINPLNAGSYIMDDAPFFDYVILFAANIRGVGSDATLYNNPNVQYILDHKDTLIKPLQDNRVRCHPHTKKKRSKRRQSVREPTPGSRCRAADSMNMVQMWMTA